jgi:RNA polymerase sigma-70 factor (ECF subfamily)
VLASARRRDAVFPDLDPHMLEFAVESESSDGPWPELERVLARLPADQREAIVLKYADDLTYEEMSRITGAGESALKMRVQRAFARLRALLQEVPSV